MSEFDCGWIDDEYLEGYDSARNGFPFDENASESWKEGYRDYEQDIFVRHATAP